MSDPIISRIFRKSCSECGCKKLKWGSLGLLVDLLPIDRRKFAAEGIEYFGASTEAWMCRRCFELGVFI